MMPAQLTDQAPIPMKESFNTRSLFEISHALGPLEMEDRLILPPASPLTIQ